MAGRSIEKRQEIVRLMNQEGCSHHHLCVVTDVTNKTQVQQLFDTVEHTYGKMDLLFNNARINTPAARIDDMSLQQFKRVLSTNVVSELSKATNNNRDGGALQLNGTRLVEPIMNIEDAAKCVYTI